MYKDKAGFGTVEYTHSLITPRWAKCFVLLGRGTICCPVMGSRHCSCQHLTLPAGLASLQRCTVSISLNGHANCTAVESWFNSLRSRVATPSPLFLSRTLGTLLIYEYMSLAYNDLVFWITTQTWLDKTC